MPTYEYKCEACGQAFEKFQSIKAAPIRKCPKCGKNRVKRLIGTGAGLIFKGGGFYITDYRSEAYKSAAKADNGAPATKEAPAEAGKESASKPAESKPAESKEAAKPAAESKAAAPPAKPAAAKSSKSAK